jgi:hypothetical protein
MNWTALGAIGELVGGVVVVVTLIYLAVQIRQNTRATQAHATGSVASEMEQVLLAIAQNEELSEAFVKASEGADLSTAEVTRLGFWWAAFVRSAHSHVVQTGLGNLSEDNRLPVKQILRQFSQVPILAAALKQMVDQELYPEDFCDWLSENVLS